LPESSVWRREPVRTECSLYTLTSGYPVDSTPCVSASQQIEAGRQSAVADHTQARAQATGFSPSRARTAVTYALTRSDTSRAPVPGLSCSKRLTRSLNLACRKTLCFQPEHMESKPMTAGKKDEIPKENKKQKPDLGQKEAAIEKEKEAELHRLGKRDASDTHGNNNKRQSR
jgi:hypothetical protein